MANIMTACLLAGSLLAMAAGSATATTDPLAHYRGRTRIVVAVAPTASDPNLLRQRAIFAGMQPGAKERDLVLVEAVGETPEAVALRREFDLGDGFQAVLVGKDGGGKLTAAEPLGAEQLFPLIDAMPMRREEMKRR